MLASVFRSFKRAPSAGSDGVTESPRTEEHLPNHGTHAGASGIPDRHIRDASEDFLGRERFANSIAESILSTPAGGTLRFGIYGGWGEGKTSVLELIRARVKASGHVCVWLAPWTASTQEEFADQVLRSIARELEIDLGQLQKAEWNAQWTQRARGAVGEFHSTAKSLDYLLGSTLQAHLDRKAQEAVDTLRKMVEEKLHGRKLVVLVDDLDRVQPALVPGVLMTLREALDQPNYFYVMALAPDVVERGLHSTHAGWGGPRQFLEKIIELPRYLPALTEGDVKTFLDAQVQRLTGLVNAEAVKNVAPILPKNPRKLKLFLRYIASLSPLLNRFGAGEIAWETLYLCQMLRIEFPEESYALMMDSEAVEDIQQGRSRDRMVELARGQEAEQQRAENRPENQYAPADEEQAERFKALCEAIRERAAIIRGRYGLSVLLRLPDEFPTLTYAEVGTFLDRLDGTPTSERVEQVQQLLSNEGHIESNRAEAFFSIVVALRQGYLDAAAEARLEDELRENVEGAQSILAIIRLVIEDLGLFREGTLGAVSWRVLYQHVAGWAHFSKLDYYEAIRAEERALLDLSLSDAPSHLLVASLDVLRPLFWEEEPTKSKEFNSLLGTLRQRAEHAAAEYILCAFQEPNGLEEFWGNNGGPVRSVLFESDSVLYTRSEYRNQLAAVAERSHDNPEIQRNFLTFFRMLCYGGYGGGGSIPRSDSRALLSDNGLLSLIWKAATARPLNPRIAGSIREHRAVLIGAGTPADVLPTPGWWVRLEESFFRPLGHETEDEGEE